MLRRRIEFIVGSSAFVFASIFALSGCGAGTGQSLNSPSLSARGGNAADGTGGPGAKGAGSVLPSKRFGLFVTDAAPQKSKVAGANDKPGMTAKLDKFLPATEYAHVYVTVHKVELLTADDQTFPVWADDAGRTVDLATLRDSTGERVALLGGVPVPGVTGKKAYKRVRITLGKGITFLKRGEASGTVTPIDDAISHDDEGRPAITITLDRPRDLGNGKEDLILAFDRASFTFADGRVTPSLREAAAGISTDVARQEPTTVIGSVSESASAGDGPERTFALTPETGTKGESLVVLMRSSAAFFRADGKPSPTLTDGAKVAVRGFLQPTTKRLIATSVALISEDEKPGTIARVLGAPSEANLEGNLLTISTEDVSNLMPTRTAITVNLASEAVLRSSNGLPITKDEFFAEVKKAGSGVQTEAEGEYEPTTGVLVAQRVRLVSDHVDSKAPRETTVFAVADTVNVDGKSLTVAAPLAEWDGIAPPASGKTWTVNTSVGTVCRDADDKAISLADLLTAAKTDTNAVRVIGTYAGGTITATRLELHPAPAKPRVEETAATTKADDKTDKTTKRAPILGARKRATSTDTEEKPTEKSDDSTTSGEKKP